MLLPGMVACGEEAVRPGNLASKLGEEDTSRYLTSESPGSDFENVTCGNYWLTKHAAENLGACVLQHGVNYRRQENETLLLLRYSSAAVRMSARRSILRVLNTMVGDNKEISAW